MAKNNCLIVQMRHLTRRMSAKTIAILIVLVVNCMSICAMQNKKVPVSNLSQERASEKVESYSNVQDHLSQETIKNMQYQIQKLEKEVELYRGDVRHEMSMKNADMSLWFTLLTIMMALLGVGLGVITPIVLNRNYKAIFDSKLEEIKLQVDSASRDARSASDSLSSVSDIQKIIQSLKERIDISEKAAEKSANEAKASEFFAQAVNETNEEDYKKAIELYSQSINLNPSNSKAYNNRGVLKRKIFDYSSALQDLDKAIELNPKYVRAYFNRGIVKKLMKNELGALQDYNKAIELNPDYSIAYNNRANVKIVLKDFNGALQDLDKAIELNPDYSIAYNNRAVLKRDELNDIEGALQDFNKAIELKPDYSRAFTNRAKYYEILAEAEENPDKKKELRAKAEEDMKKVQELESSRGKQESDEDMK